jgi:hypothetical protein
MKGSKIVKVEPVYRDKEDFLVNVWHKNRNITKESDPDLIEKLPLKDRVRLGNRSKNSCCICSNEATRQITITVKAVKGVLKLERYCDQCFEERADVDKMRMRV